jgi:hypothetical protein
VLPNTASLLAMTERDFALSQSRSSERTMATVQRISRPFDGAARNQTMLP